MADNAKLNDGGRKVAQDFNKLYKEGFEITVSTRHYLKRVSQKFNPDNPGYENEQGLDDFETADQHIAWKGGYRIEFYLSNDFGYEKGQRFEKVKATGIVVYHGNQAADSMTDYFPGHYCDNLLQAIRWVNAQIDYDQKRAERELLDAVPANQLAV